MRVTRSLAIGLALALALTVSGCTSEPSLKDAADELQKDTHRLETDDLFKNPLMKLRVLQRPEKDIPCDKGKFKRVLRATADDERADEPLTSHLGRAQAVMENVLAQRLGYKVDSDPSQENTEEGRFIQGSKSSGISVVVYVSPEPPTWRLHAMTSCLPR
ncbi:hypothetical protein AB0D67_27995 [Streptosporangium sp. NPDC048047]|uniref:hypothetical protein n=1 Tax=Streptosporangium sp. NPDC048047 TaxID=3155748 RepID=UPI003431E48B